MTRAGDEPSASTAARDLRQGAPRYARRIDVPAGHPDNREDPVSDPSSDVVLLDRRIEPSDVGEGEPL